MSDQILIGYLDCSTGVSGDKLLGALLDAGTGDDRFTPRDLQSLVSALAPEGTVRVERVRSAGLSALGVRIEALEAPAHRTWADIRSIIGAARLPEPVRAEALAVFELLTTAEAGAHGCPVDQVHFHEVGALDSIMDVVGVCSAVHALGLRRLAATPVATGWGQVDTSHGILPVPAPATALLLCDIPTQPGPAGSGGSAPGELTTPTGAALLKVLVSEYGPCPPLTPHAVGYGAGTRDIGHPNVCRLTIGTPAPPPIPLEQRSVSVLESNLDHLSGEAASVAVEQLRAEGVLDAWISPVLMKKSRPALIVSVLVPVDRAQEFAQRMVALTGTLGVRRLDLDRWEAPRQHAAISTAYGSVRVKVGPVGALHSVRPEADDVARIAREIGRPFSAVQAELTALAVQELGLDR